MIKKYINKARFEYSIVTIGLIVILFFPPAGVLIAFLFVLVYLLPGKNRSVKFRSIGFTTPVSWWKTVLISLGMGILIEFSFQVLLNPLIERATHAPIDLTAYESMRGDIPRYLFMLVFGWIAGGFMEEILFRGFLLTRISSLFKNKNIGIITGILITSAAFGFSHLYQGWSGVISTGSIAVFLGIIFIKSRWNLWYPILTHGFVNMTSLTLVFANYDQILNNLIF